MLMIFDSLNEYANQSRGAYPPGTAARTTSWSALREAAKDCEACHLYKRATQTVFGEGPKAAR